MCKYEWELKFEEIKKILKSRAFRACAITVIVTGIIFYFVGISVADDSITVGNLESKIVDLENNRNTYIQELRDKDDIIKELQSKVDEAKPWFDLKEEERKAEEQRLAEEKAKKEEEERIAKEQEEARKAEEERKAKEEAEAKKQAELEAKKITLGNGNYVAGTDFEAGTYDIVAIEGGGNVSSDNMFSGGLNAVMGVANDGFYEKEYKNIKLPKGVTLKISGVKIQLIPKNI